MRARALVFFCAFIISCGGTSSSDGGSGGGGFATGGGTATGGGGNATGGGSSTGGGAAGGGSSTGGGGSATGGGGGGGGTSDAGTVTVAMLQQQTFIGCFGEGCHSCGLIIQDGGCEWNSKPMSLYASPQDFCASVVNVTAISSPSKVRVKPFDPDNSFMVQKLEGHLNANEGSQMPPGGPLTQAQIQLLRDWISQGALPN